MSYVGYRAVLVPDAAKASHQRSTREPEALCGDSGASPCRPSEAQHHAHEKVPGGMQDRRRGQDTAPSGGQTTLC